MLSFKSTVVHEASSVLYWVRNRCLCRRTDTWEDMVIANGKGGVHVVLDWCCAARRYLA